MKINLTKSRRCYLRKQHRGVIQNTTVRSLEMYNVHVRTVGLIGYKLESNVYIDPGVIGLELCTYMCRILFLWKKLLK